MMDFKQVIEEIYQEVNDMDDQGQLASYIPELSNVNPSHFGVHLSMLDHRDFGIGDSNQKFSIQSIAKVFSLSMAYGLLGVEIWQRLGVEPSGTKFNSLVQLESDRGIPRNPFINAGALVISDILLSQLNSPKTQFLSLVRDLANNDQINYSDKIALSEKSIGYRNAAMCNLIKSFGNIENEPAEVLDFYYDLCSIEMTCQELSNSFLYLTNNGVNPVSNKTILTKSQSKRINALMQTCGFYDESGEFAFKVGLPGKSGVGGGIAAVYPGKYAIAAWSPKLNDKGNSYKGMLFFEKFTTRSESSIF